VPHDLRAELVACGAVRFGDFTLASGAKSRYYVDIKKASANPRVLRAIADAIAPRADRYDYVAGMELGAVPIAVSVSLVTGKPFLIVRKEAKKHGTGSRIEGDFEAGKRALVVEDVTTSGGSSLEAVKVLREAGLVVDRCVVVVDRDAGATKTLGEAGVALDPLVRASELLEGNK
jgi:orotate phosphoribosyltransferase